MGIAGSLDPTVAKGDVLVADYVKAYQDGRMLKAGAFDPYMQFQEPTDQALRTNANVFAETTEWWRGLGDRPDGKDKHPTLHFGGLASGDAVVEDTDSSYFVAIRNSDSWLRAVEMESAGLALAVRHLKESGKVTGLMVVRGISDVPSGVEAKDSATVQVDTNRETRKNWTKYASQVAALFLAQFIRHGFPYSPEASDEPGPDSSGPREKRQFDPDVFTSYQSHFVRADELPTVHSINDQTFDAADLVPTATLELWWRCNPLCIRLVQTTRGENVGYWQVLLLTKAAFESLSEGQLVERQIGVADLLSYQELIPGSVYVYITAVAVLESMRHRSASVLLDLIVFIKLIDDTIGIDGISAQPVSDDPLNVMANFGMVHDKSENALSTWLLNSREQILRALQIGRRHLTQLQGMIPDVPQAEHDSLVQLLRR
jgi:nucleoside phosphorylase